MIYLSKNHSIFVVACILPLFFSFLERVNIVWTERLCALRASAKSRGEEISHRKPVTISERRVGSVAAAAAAAIVTWFDHTSIRPFLKLPFYLHVARSLV